MIIGDWEVDESGKIKHLKCHELGNTWSFIHKCWQDAGYTSTTGHPAGRYIEVVCPLLVQEIAKVKYYLWNNERAKALLKGNP